MRLLGETALRRCRVTAVVAGNLIHHGKNLFGRDVIPPALLRDFVTPQTAIVVGSLVNAEGIRKDLTAMGLGNPVIELGGTGEK